MSNNNYGNIIIEQKQYVINETVRLIVTKHDV